MTGIDPYTGVWGGYLIATDPTSGLNVLDIYATANEKEGRVNRSITEFVGRWDINFRINDDNSQFWYPFLCNSNSNPFPGYALKAELLTNTASLIKLDTDGNETILLSTTLNNPNDTHTMSVNVDTEGNFEFWFDGISIGTIIDTDYTTFSYEWIRVWSGSGVATVFINWIKFNDSFINNWNPLNITQLMSANPIFSGSGWDNDNVGCPRIINIDGQLRMYHLGSGNGIAEISYAVENGSLESWNNDSEPLGNFETGADGVRIGSIIQIGDTYYMYQGTEPASGIYVSTSTDGINFTLVSSPVLSADNDIGEPCINLPYVIEADGTYYMYYTNYNGDYTHPYQHKVASSTDGLNWIKHGVVNEIGESGEWDDTLIEDKTVYFDGTTFYLTYEGYNGSYWCIGTSTSINPLGPFIKLPSNPILSPSYIPDSFDQYQVATPYLYESEGIVYLFYQGGNNPSYNSAQWRIGIATVADINTEPVYSGIQLETIEANITLLDFANESILVLLESLENVITLVDFANTPRLVTLEILQATTSFTGLGIPTYLNTLESSISLEDITFTTSFPTIVNLDVFSSTSLLNNFTVYTVRNVIISLNALNPLINLNDVVIIAERILWGKLTDNLAEPLSSDCSLVYDIFRENVDQNQTIQNANIELGTSAYPQIAQIFQPSQSDLTGIGIWAMGTVGTPTGIITASIYEMNYDSRISLLQQWEIPNGFWGDNIETLIPFDLTLLDTTTSYAFALSIDTVDDDNYYILGTSLKKGGNLKYQTGQGNWNNYGGDLWFNSYYPINVYTNQTPPIDLSAIPYTAIKFRAKLSSKGIQENSNILVSEGFKQNVTEQGQLISVGAFDFDWDGSEKIYLASSYPSKPSSNLIWADDELIITTSKGSISVTCGSKDYKKGMVYPFVYFAPAPDISSLLEEGANHVEVFVQDIYGGYIGCSELHIIFTESNSDSPEINNWAITKEDVYT